MMILNNPISSSAMIFFKISRDIAPAFSYAEKLFLRFARLQSAPCKHGHSNQDRQYNIGHDDDDQLSEVIDIARHEAHQKRDRKNDRHHQNRQLFDQMVQISQSRQSMFVIQIAFFKTHDQARQDFLSIPLIPNKPIKAEAR